MNAERDELAEVIHKALADVTGIYDTTDDEDKGLADFLLAAGYRKPHTIATREELDALPVGTAIIDDEPPVWLWTKTWESKHPRKDGTPLSKWSARGYDDERETSEIPLPATVVWEPTA